jgi:hypothetical protein
VFARWCATGFGSALAMFLFFFWEGSTPLRFRSFFFEIGARWRWRTQDKYHRVFLQPCPRPFFPRLPFRFFLSISFFFSPFPHHTCSLIISSFFQNLHSSHLPPRHSLLRCGPRTPYTRACIFFFCISSRPFSFLYSGVLAALPISLPRPIPPFIPTFAVFRCPCTFHASVFHYCVVHTSVIACRRSPRSPLSY